mmetsp:Transcript_16905/g.48084  ORF Transcript_16905/g.48084 Transcript_16905/m.48084 type:complete len:202 (+) Transcript_16905:651-1256(+)
MQDRQPRVRRERGALSHAGRQRLPGVAELGHAVHDDGAEPALHDGEGRPDGRPGLSGERQRPRRGRGIRGRPGRARRRGQAAAVGARAGRLRRRPAAGGAGGPASRLQGPGRLRGGRRRGLVPRPTHVRAPPEHLGPRHGDDAPRLLRPRAVREGRLRGRQPDVPRGRRRLGACVGAKEGSGSSGAQLHTEDYWRLWPREG